MMRWLEGTEYAPGAWTIEVATCEDIPKITGLYRQLIAHMAALQPDNFQLAEQSEDMIRAAIEEEQSDFVIVRNGGDVIGFALVQQKETPPFPSFIPRRYAYLMDIVVDSAHRGQGVGKALLGAVEGWARSRGAEFVELGVVSNNAPAIGLYESFGFAENRKTMRLML